MFAIMRDRLEDIDDLLLQDVSPREAWANIAKEHLMRRELARELRSGANSMYTVDQEAATADKKETDIRLRGQRRACSAIGIDRTSTGLFGQDCVSWQRRGGGLAIAVCFS